MHAYGEWAIQYQLGHALWMLHRVGDRDRAPAGDPQERKPVEPGSVHDCFEIADPRLEVHNRQIGLPHSKSRWVSQFDAFTSGGPLPTLAYARRTPSLVVQYRISWRTFEADEGDD